MKDTGVFLEWVKNFLGPGFKELDGRDNYWNIGPVENAEGYGKISGICGDTMEIWLKIADGAITEARFLTDGCMSSQLCGAAAAWLATREKLIDALDISPADVIRLLLCFEGVENHCAILAVSTLYRAIADYILKTGCDMSGEHKTLAEGP
ncbi:MAG: iron-sulfur cluster assembly scaffold protein [bacterium]